MSFIRKNDLYRVVNFIYLLDSFNLLEDSEAERTIKYMLDYFGVDN